MPDLRQHRPRLPRRATSAPAGDTSSNGAAVQLAHVSKSYGALVPALRDVSFDVAPGEFVLLTGASGSGKSTVLNLVAGLVAPDSGSVVVDGQLVSASGDPARFRREVIGFVFQLHHLLLELTALENVEIALIPTGLGRRERLARARAALVDVGLGDRVTHRPAQLSGGERQRVAIARAIVGRPRLLLADEPTGALDFASSTQILELLARLRDEHAMSVLLVSYDPAAAGYADRVLYLRDGAIEDDERAAELRPERP